MKDRFLRSTPAVPRARTVELQAFAERQACFFRVLGNPRRLLVLWLLSERSMTVDALAEATGWARATAAHHLRILKYGGLVDECTEQGGIRYQLVRDNELRGILFSTKRPAHLLELVELQSLD